MTKCSICLQEVLLLPHKCKQEQGKELVKASNPRELSDEEIVFTENEVNILKNAIENYVCTIKSELTEEQNTFKGYERCSNIKTILSELEDAERALEILKKASEK